MAFREYAPYGRTESQGMRQNLENDIAIRRSISKAAQRRETQRMRRVVGHIEAALHGDAGVLRVCKPDPPERIRPANSFASGNSSRRDFPGPHRLSSGEVTFVT